ncbi:MAG TPA: phosphatase PAP2 family protein [Blastococcus sp.]|nr:phosphatase PAP2 family protein [Blastococcus sp.]
MTSGVIRDAAVPGRSRVVSVGRPPWWAVALAIALLAGVIIDLLARGALERLDLRVSEIVSRWGLVGSGAYPLVWALTQVGGRVTILVVLAGLVGYLGWRRRTWLPAARVLLGLGLLTLAVYAIKTGMGRTAPGYPGSFFFHSDGASFPSGHVANAVLMWGIARWQAVEYGLPSSVQRLFWGLSVVGPVVAGAAMVSLDFHWVSDAVAGAALGVILLGVVHALDAVVLSRWVRAPAGQLP